MHKDNHQSPTAIAYAQAILDLATEQNVAEDIGQELRDLRQVLDTNPDFAEVLANPGIGHEVRSQLLRNVFENRCSHLLLNFLLLVSEKDRMALLPAIAGAYDDLLDERHGKIEVDVTVSHRLNNDQFEAVRQKVSAALKRDAVVHVYVDESIIGGLVLRVRDQLIDGSVRAQLAAMKRQMLAARPKH